jgi:BirA family transcriptional regulator, biotin operon repressor / biotin---[acetyl-CoA-carboxylase] ligase
MDETDLERALASAGLEAPVRFDEVTGSTNATALEMAERGWPEWTLVAAGHQISGRGRLGRTWQDDGDSLLFSLLLRPAIEPSRVGLLSLLAGASMAEAIRVRTGIPVSCKWPNDLLLDGRKVGGILAESRIEDGSVEHVALGLGVNLGTPPVADAAGLSGRVAAAELLGSFMGMFSARYMPGHPAFPQAVIGAWRPLAATLGRVIEATTMQGDRVKGRAVDVDASGGLIIETDDGALTVAFGEIEHVDR